MVFCASVIEILQLDNSIAYYSNLDFEAYLNEDGVERCNYFYTDSGELRRPTSSDVRDAYLPEISALMRNFSAGDRDQSFAYDDEYVEYILN
jgi:hypothetical protein